MSLTQGSPRLGFLSRKRRTMPLQLSAPRVRVGEAHCLQDARCFKKRLRREFATKWTTTCKAASDHRPRRGQYARTCARRDSSTLDSDQFHTARRSALDRHCSLHAVKVVRHQNDEFLVRPTLDSRSSDLGHPTAVGQLHQRGTACIRFDLHADNCPEHRFLRYRSFQARGMMSRCGTRVARGTTPQGR
jgi:hypothetical protein